MSRLTAWMGLLTALWTPLGAVADTVMCLEPSLEPVALQASQNTAEREADWVPRLPLVPLGDSPYDDDRGVAWCATPDDPRCAQLPSDPAPRSVEARTPLNAMSEAPRHAPWPSENANATPRYGLCPSAGVSARVDRPPRDAG